ncbi:hypothetical protein HDU78_003043 [Chytriomyces hyalinus]|nr:hypothetical protein HDU78_003043 [Chytriomyces hyalinus]
MIDLDKDEDKAIVKRRRTRAYTVESDEECQFEHLKWQRELKKSNDADNDEEEFQCTPNDDLVVRETKNEDDDQCMLDSDIISREEPIIELQSHWFLQSASAEPINAVSAAEYVLTDLKALRWGNTA